MLTLPFSRLKRSQVSRSNQSLQKLVSSKTRSEPYTTVPQELGRRFLNRTIVQSREGILWRGT